MNANAEYLEHLYKFWDKYWNMIDREMTGGDVPETLDKFKRELRQSKYVRWWSLANLADWGLKGGCIGHSVASSMLKDHEENNPYSEVPQGYLLWEWEGKRFLIDGKTYDAYNTILAGKQFNYAQYEPIRQKTMENKNLSLATRERIFRGIAEDKDGEWISGSLVMVHDFCLAEGGEYYKAYIFPILYPLPKKNSWPVLPHTVGLYTEKKDCRGKDIFEGDILACEYEEDGKVKTMYLAVEYNSKEAAFCLRFLGSLGCATLGEMLRKYPNMYVAGDIYHNPELLKEK